MNDESKELVEEQAFSWLEMHKKSALSFLVLRALEQNTMWSKDLLDWITQTTGWAATDRGLYRVLRRLQRQGSIIYTSESAERTGAERKVYRMTPEGMALLASMKTELKYISKILPN